jgi:hypothetical protein
MTPENSEVDRPETLSEIARLRLITASPYSPTQLRGAGYFRAIPLSPYAGAGDPNARALIPAPSLGRKDVCEVCEAARVAMCRGEQHIVHIRLERSPRSNPLCTPVPALVCFHWSAEEGRDRCQLAPCPRSRNACLSASASSGTGTSLRSGPTS